MDDLLVTSMAGVTALLVSFIFRFLASAIRGLDPDTLALPSPWDRRAPEETADDGGRVEEEGAALADVLERFVGAAHDLEMGAVLALGGAALAAAASLGAVTNGLGTALASLGFAPLVALVCVVVPERLAAGREASILRRTTAVVLALAGVLHPLARAADLVARPLAMLAGVGRGPEPGAEIPRAGRTAAEAGEMEPPPPPVSGLREVLAFVNATVDEVMTPRAEIVAVESGATVSDLARIVRTTRRSTFPIYRATLDDVAGIVTVADLLAAGPEELVDRHAREATVVPESKRVLDLATEMRVVRNRLVLVVDEFGTIAGVANVHDLVGELVGEVAADEARQGFEGRRLDADTWILNPLVRLERVSEITGFSLPAGDYQTLAGYILWQLGRVPLPHERLRVPAGEIEILAADERKILSVRFRRGRSGHFRRAGRPVR